MGKKPKDEYVPRDKRDKTASPENDAEETKEAPMPSKPSSGTVAAARIKERSALLKTIAAIQEQTHFGANAKVGDTTFSGAPIDEATKSTEAVAVLYTPINQLQSQLATDPNGETARKVQAALKFARSNSLYDIDWSGYDSPAASNAVIALPDNSLDLLEGIVAGRTFDISDVRAGRTEEQYSAVISDILAKRKDFTAVGSKDGVNPVVTADASASDAVPALMGHAASLSDLALQWQEHYDGNGPKPVSDLNASQVFSQAKDLARIIQAYKNRDAVRAPREESGPKAEASDKEAVRAMGTNLREKAQPFQEDISSMIGMDEVSSQVDALVNQAVVAKQREAA